MKTRLGLVFALALLGALPSVGGCAGGTATAARAHMDEVRRLRDTPAARESQKLAPQALASAEAIAKQAEAAERQGDEAAAALLAERAVAAYSHAFVLARLARATREASEAQATEVTTREEAQRLARSRELTDREGDDLEKQLTVAREALAPPPSGPADTTREAARLVAARSLATQARLLCGAARLVALDAPGLAEAETALADVEKTILGTPKAAPIDAAARVRARCLGVLSRARRLEGAPTGQADTLLSELSAAGGWDPVRDERGVVVVLRDTFAGARLSTAAEGKLAELGRIAAAHPAFGVQVVVHDATAPSEKEKAADQARADACVNALVAAGAAAPHVHAELAGARAPLVDAKDPAAKTRNARVEIVFVPKGT